jgi:asparagine synthase (glutamine-hydrolysing)
MCGIAGIVGNRTVSEAEVRLMSDAISHRGPDGDGVFVRDGVGLGHRRLSIIDLEGGRQPMSNGDGSIWITFNGEIYNYQELRRRLEPRYPFKTQSDTEVIIHLYEEYGDECVNHLRGMFAFAIYDFENCRLLMARDHLGQKPLYYADQQGTLAFASEIKALLAHNPDLRRVNDDALHEYLTLRIITPPRSMFRGVHKLPPGHILVRTRDGASEVRRYWSLRYEPKHSMGYDDLMEALDAKIEEAVNFHMVSDVPVGAFLSGGLDSSLVVSMMSRRDTGAFKTFSGDVPYASYSELPYARMVAEKYGTDAHELTIVPSVVRGLPKLVRFLDEPSDPLSTCLYHIAELARKHVKVVLGGDGGDELFGGYDRYYGNRYVSYYAMLPEVVRRRVIGPLLRLVPEGHWYRSMSHRLQWVDQMSYYSAGERYAKSLGYFYFSEGYRKSLYTEQFNRSIGAFDPDASIKHYFSADNARDLVDRMLYADSMTRMPDHPVMILDRMTMAHGLEARSPFMDHELAEFCAQLPARYKVRGHHLRYIQTRLAEKYLPQALIRRKKQGFSSPLTYLLADEFRLLYRSLLKDSRLVASGYFHKPAVDELLNKHLSGGADHGQRLWQLCNAEVWYRMHIEQQGEEEIEDLIHAMAPRRAQPASAAA